MLYKLVLLLFLVFIAKVEVRASTLSNEDNFKKFKNEKILIYLDKDRNLFNYKTNDKNEGLYYSWVKRLEEITEMKFEIIEKSHSEFEEGINKGIPDLVFGIEDTRMNSDTYSYVDKPLLLPAAILSDKSAPVISSESELINRKTVSIEGDLLNNKTLMFDVEVAPSSKIGIEGIINKDYDFYLEDLQEALILIQEHSNFNLKINTLSDNLKTEYYFGVRKKYSILLKVLEDILDEYNFDKKFAHRKVLNYIKNIQLSSKNVKKYFNDKSTLKVYIPPKEDVFPLYFRDDEFIEKGVLIEYFSEIESILDVEVEFIEGDLDKCDINPFVLLINNEIKGDQGSYLTTPYYEFQYLIFNNRNSDYVFSINGLEETKIAVVKGSITEVFLNEKGYKNNLLYYDSQVEVLEAVNSGKADIFLGGIKGTDLIIKKHDLNNIKVAGVVQDRVSLAFGVLSSDFVLHKTLNFLEKNYFFDLHLKNRDYIENSIGLINQYKVSILTIIISISVAIFFLRHIKKVVYINKRLKELNIGLIKTLETANSFNDEDTGVHIKRVGRYCEIIAKELKLPKKLSNKIVLYSSLHDIGKIGISDSILKKESKLSNWEFNEMKRHPEIGYEMLKELNIDEVALNIIRYHHERWDSKGYNFGLHQEEIPIEARIMSLADVYDALRQKRAYKEAYTHEAALKVIQLESGKHFDPNIVNAFIRKQHLIKKAYDEEGNKP